MWLTVAMHVFHIVNTWCYHVVYFKARKLNVGMAQAASRGRPKKEIDRDQFYYF